VSRNKRKKNKPKIPQSGNKKVKGEDPRTSELIDGLKGVAIDWIEKPNLYLKTVYSIIWLYFIIRVFITDIDLNIATSYFSIDNSTYVIGRALLIALILMVYWQIMGTKEIIKYSILFFVFPFHPIGFKIAKFFVWRVPKYLIKKEDYYFIYSYIDVIISCIVHIKNRLTFLILFCIGIFLLTKLNGIYLYVPILIFVVLQISHIIKRYRETFSPIKVFQMKVVN